MKHLFTHIMTFLAVLLFSTCAFAQENSLRIFTEISPSATMYLKDGSLGGFGVEIVKAIQKELGDATPIEVVPWARGFKFLSENSDVALMPTTRTEEREDLFHWVGPLMTINWTLYGLSGRRFNINTLEDAKKADGIGVYREDVRARYLQEQGFTNLQTVDSQDTNLRKLLRHRIDLIASSDIGMKGLFDKNRTLRGRLQAVLSFRKVDLYLAFSKETSPETLEMWNRAYDKLRRNGVISSIQKKWK